MLRPHEDAAPEPLRRECLQPYQEVRFSGRRQGRNGEASGRGVGPDPSAAHKIGAQGRCQFATAGNPHPQRCLKCRGAGLLHLDVHAEPDLVRHLCGQGYPTAQLCPRLRPHHAPSTGRGPSVPHRARLSASYGARLASDAESRRRGRLRSLPGRCGGSNAGDGAMRPLLSPGVLVGIPRAGTQARLRWHRLPNLLQPAHLRPRGCGGRRRATRAAASVGGVGSCWQQWRCCLVEEWHHAPDQGLGVQDLHQNRGAS
mmetsp:Transcript_116106/g.248363  ORF Transcript_116106/g.248363 Transcript_116106/m.248363 type:complete len:257 (-) Transcript_116106:468-1238(-)